MGNIVDEILENPKDFEWLVSDEAMEQWCDEVFKGQQEMLK